MASVLMRPIAISAALVLSAALSLGAGVAQAKTASQWLAVTAGVQIGIHQAMEKAQMLLPGKVIEIELEEGKKGAAPYYKVTLISVGNEMVTLRVSAATGDAAIDEKKGRAESKHFRRLADTRITLAQAVDAAVTARPGKPLEAKLDSDWGRTHYKIKLLQADRVVMKVKVDSATGAVIDSKKD